MNSKLRFLLISLFIFFVAALQASADGDIRVSGVVMSEGEPLPGASVLVKGTHNGTVTDVDGKYTLTVPADGTLVFSFIGLKTTEQKVNGRTVVNAELLPDSEQLDEVMVVAYATAKKYSFTGAASTVKGSEIAKMQVSNVSRALEGTVSGLQASAPSGQPGTDAEIRIRGIGSINASSAPLYVVDGVPFDGSINSINPEDIASLTVLKDAASAALYGSRGANGVIIITTKQGHTDSKTTVSINASFGGSNRAIRDYDRVGTNQYFELYWEALRNQYALNSDKYTPQTAAAQASKDLVGKLMGGGPNPYGPNYPQPVGTDGKLLAGATPLWNVDWQKEALRNHTTSHQLDITFRGGGKRLRYFSVLNYKNDMGLLNSKYTDYTDRYNSQMKKYFLNLRMNLDVDITDATKLKLNMLGMLRETKRPTTSEATLFEQIFNTPSAAFPVQTQNGLWGSNNVLKTNPIANLADVGYYKLNQRMLQADLRLIQDLSVLTRGLSAELAIAYDNNATYQETAKKSFMYQTIEKGTDGEPVYTNYGNPNDELEISNKGLANQYIHANFEAKVNYHRTWDKHDFTASAMFRQESMTLTGANNSRYRQYIIGTVGYNFDNRYMVDVVANCFGSSVLGKNDKYRAYPAISAAWILSNENFMKGISAFDYLKLRASYGRSGYDIYDYDMDKQYWIGSGSYYFQAGNTSAGSSLKEGMLAMEQLDLEVADKYNIGLDMSLLKGLTFSIDGFYDKRSNILIDGSGLISSAIGVTIPQMNAGKVETKGTELSTMWKKEYKNFSYYIGANFSYAKSKVIENGEGYQPYGYLSKKGYPIGQCFGWEAIGYFRDEEDIKNSPVQKFSEVRPGDVKYRDLNGDKVIDSNDQKAIGYSTAIPEIYYGINLGFEYKGFGVDALFQGVGHYSVMLNTASVYWPLRNNTNISNWYLNDKIRWTEDTKDIANVPRLTTLDNANNFRNSTQWLENGSYFKLRNLNVYYNFPSSWAKKVKMEKIQVYARANNLFSLDHVKYMNCEDLKINYPDMTSVYFGLNINF